MSTNSMCKSLLDICGSIDDFLDSWDAKSDIHGGDTRKMESF